MICPMCRKGDAQPSWARALGWPAWRCTASTCCRNRTARRARRPRPPAASTAARSWSLRDADYIQGLINQLGQLTKAVAAQHGAEYVDHLTA